MGSVSSVRAGLKTRLATISGLTATAVAPATVNVPAAYIVPGSIDFDQTMGRGSDLLNFSVVLLVAQATTELAQSDLDAYLVGSGAQSVKAAIEGDGTLGGAAQWTRVTRVSVYGLIEHQGVSYLGAKFDVEVDVNGT